MFPNAFKEHTCDQHSKASAYHPVSDRPGPPVKNCSKGNLQFCVLVGKTAPCSVGEENRLSVTSALISVYSLIIRWSDSFSLRCSLRRLPWSRPSEVPLKR